MAGLCRFSAGSWSRPERWLKKSGIRTGWRHETEKRRVATRPEWEAGRCSRGAGREKWVSSLRGAAAPNQNALSNGRKISGSGGFVRRMRSEDERYYGGECKGSGKNNYRVSVFFEEGAAPVFRCSCPSRQFPCKHSIALMFEMAAKKDFELCEIPEDILEKQRKLVFSQKDRGLMLLCFEGAALGFGRYRGGRIKNIYPKGLRRSI